MGRARRRAGAGHAVGVVPRLMDASPAGREAAQIGTFGLHWEALDEDVSVEGLLAGRGDRTARGPEAA